MAKRLFGWGTLGIVSIVTVGCVEGAPEDATGRAEQAATLPSCDLSGHKSDVYRAVKAKVAADLDRRFAGSPISVGSINYSRLSYHWYDGGKELESGYSLEVEGRATLSNGTKLEIGGYPYVSGQTTADAVGLNGSLVNGKCAADGGTLHVRNVATSVHVMTIDLEGLPIYAL
jgi:hypothetical protein